MTAPTDEIVIQNAIGNTVGRFNVKNELLHGRCVWFDGNGNPVADGIFEEGIPFTGSFLNWANFFPDVSKAAPYDLKVYRQDWVSRFEECFRSQRPKYDMVLETYVDGTRVRD